MKHIFLLAAGYSISAQQLGIPTDNTTVGGGMAGVVKILIMLIGMGAIVMIIVGGMQIALAAGNPARFKQGRETVIYSVVGVLIAIAAYAIVSFISTQLK